MEKRILQDLPKAELHIHLEGAMRPSTLTELCAKHSVHRPEDTQGKRFEDFGPFALCYMAVCECLREEEDLFRLVREVAEDAAASGAVWLEPALSVVLYAERFGGVEATLGILVRAAAAAEEATGLGMAFIVAAERHLAPVEAVALAQSVRRMVSDGQGASSINGRPGIIGFGLHSAEVGNPPDPFADAFGIACGAGEGQLAAIPHAGELPPFPGQGPQSVRFCVEKLGARRISHGVLAAEDQELVVHLSQAGVCLDVCPTSNVLLQVFGTYAEHPLPRLLQAGVACSINSDDPLLFGCSLLSEYEVCRRELGMDDDALASCARFSLRHSHAPEEIKQRGLAGVEAWLLSLPGGGGEALAAALA